MKANSYRIIFILIFLLQILSDANSQVPVFKLSILNFHNNLDCKNDRDSTFDFDIYLQDISPGPHDPFIYATGQYYLNFNTGIINGYTNDSVAIRKIASDLPTSNQNTSFSTAGGRFSCATP